MERTAGEGRPPDGIITRMQERGDWLRVEGVVGGRKASIDLHKKDAAGKSRAELEKVLARNLHHGVE